MARRKKLALLRGDHSLWIIIAVLCVVSILVVYSSTASMAYRDRGGDTSFYVLRQARFILAGFFTIIVVHWIDYKFYARFARTLFWVSVSLVVMAYFVGVSLNDASRWLEIPGIGLTFLPSDPLKISLIMLLAAQLGSRQRVINQTAILPALTPGGWRREPQKNFDTFFNVTRPLIVPIAVAALVVMPANLSTAMIIVLIAVVMLLVGRVRTSEIWRLMWVSIMALVMIIGVMKVLGVGRAETWINRVESFVEPIVGGHAAADKAPEDEFQKEQARIAVASGGVLGKGPGNSTQRSQLPHPYSDFAYAFIIEEYGIFGGLVILTLYLWIFYRAGVIMRKSRKPAPSLLVLGLSLMITVQAFINIAVSVGIVPVTGQSLPLISLGGSSVFFTCIAFGMILGISRETDEDEAELLAEQAAAAARLEQEEAQSEDNPVEEQIQLPEPLAGRKTNSKLFARATPSPTDDDQDEQSPFIVVENPHLEQRNSTREVVNLDDQ